MKKFLSVILMLTMLIAPVGAASNFTAGVSKYDFVDDLNNANFDIIFTKIKVNATGAYNAKISIYGREDELITEIVFTEADHNLLIENVLEEFNIYHGMRSFDTPKAELLIESIQSEGTVRAIARFFNANNEVVRTVPFGIVL